MSPMGPMEFLMRELDRVAGVRELKLWQPAIERADKLCAAQAIKVEADIWKHAFYQLLEFSGTSLSR